MSPAEAVAVVSRLAQFAAAAVVGGGSLFVAYGVSPRGRWPNLLVGLAAGFGAAGTLAWLMAQTAQISDAPSDAFRASTLWSVASGAGFGRAALARLCFFGLAIGAAPGRWRGQWLVLGALGAAASASFAWTGHGVKDEGLAGLLHVVADVVHLLAASTWIGALVVLAVLVLIAARRSATSAARDALTGLVRFSAIGVTVVAILVASGLVNGWFLVGPGGLARLPTTPYGRLLLAKLALFALMLALAAANRYRLTPRLERALRDPGGQGATTFRSVAATVLTETALAVAVLALVSWLGTLSPPIDA